MAWRRSCAAADCSSWRVEHSVSGSRSRRHGPFERATTLEGMDQATCGWRDSVLRPPSARRRVAGMDQHSFKKRQRHGGTRKDRSAPSSGHQGKEFSVKVVIAFLSIFLASGLTMVTVYNTLVDAK